MKLCSPLMLVKVGRVAMYASVVCSLVAEALRDAAPSLLWVRVPGVVLILNCKTLKPECVLFFVAVLETENS